MTSRFQLGLPLLALAGCNAAPDRAAANRGNDAVAETAAPAPTPAADKRKSRFTTVTDGTCKLIEQNEETGDWTRMCAGVEPYKLEWGSGDLRDDLTVVDGDRRSPLQIPSIVARGPFDSIGETVEWRGPSGGPPDVLVARVHVARPDGTNDSGRLVVARLGDKPCLVAVIPPEKDQSARARQIADGTLSDCLQP